MLGCLAEEVVVQHWYAKHGEVQEVAPGVVTGVGPQQCMVPEWHQASANASSQLLQVLQVGGLLSSELWLRVIAGCFLQAKCHKVPAE